MRSFTSLGLILALSLASVHPAAASRHGGRPTVSKTSERPGGPGSSDAAPTPSSASPTAGALGGSRRAATLEATTRTVPARPTFVTRLKTSSAKVTAAVRRSSGKLAGHAARAGSWIRQNPKTSAALFVGTIGMLATMWYLAPFVKSVVGAALIGPLGETIGPIVGLAVGGALASGSRSFIVHVFPMATGYRPWNRKQLAVDVSMSTGFGFIGFAQAAGLGSLISVLGISGVAAVAGVTLTALVGWELVKDAAQIKIRNRWATTPKSFWEEKNKIFLLEVLTNWHRALPGLSTSFTAKVIGDIAGTVFWDKVVNSLSKEKRAEAAAAEAAAANAAQSPAPGPARLAMPSVAPAPM